MSFATGTNAEVLYSMPVVGATKTTTTSSLVSGNSGTNPAFLMPALGSIWPVSSMQGKVLQVWAAGTYDATAVTSQLGLYFDATQATQGTLIAGTGAVTVPSTTTGEWNMEVTLTCIGTGAVTSSNWNTAGQIAYGPGNNAAAAAATVAMVGGANTAGVPTSLLLSNTASNFWELWSVWGTAPTAFVCSQFIVMGLN